jgi:hypothetical protein
MKLEVVLVIGLGACSSSSSSPPVIAANKCPSPELSCKDALEKAGIAAKLRDRDVTMAIGECEQQSWNIEARRCVAAAHANADLVTCGNTFKLTKQGIFAESMSPEKAIATMTRFRDDMCACKDSACAQKVSDDMTKWGQEEMRTNREPPKLSDDDVKRFTQIGEDMGHCMQKAMGGGSP